MASLLPPDAERLAALSAHYRFGLSANDLEEFAPAVAATLASTTAIEWLYERTDPPPAHRAWAQPEPEHNSLGAWYVTADVTESARGPLAGRTVAIKDNIAVAGVPMMNGSRTVEGFVPRYDATAVRRLLAAGTTIKGKAVCEDLCFSGASFTSHPGPVRNPWDERRIAGGHRAAAVPWWPVVPSIRRSAGTRAGRSAFPVHSAESSGTSPPTAWCRTPVRSRSSAPSITSVR